MKTKSLIDDTVYEAFSTRRKEMAEQHQQQLMILVLP